MIASLNIMAKTFKKNCQNVCWIVGDDCCNKKKTCPYSSFRSKIYKNGLKNEIYAKQNWARSTWIAKGQIWKKPTVKPTSKVNSQSNQQSDDVSKMTQMMM